MITNLTCFGPIEHFAAIIKNGGAMLSTTEPWHKQTVRNRYVIMTANGPQTLSIPVSVGKATDATPASVSVGNAPGATPSGKPTIASVTVSDHGNWRHQHWQALLTAYGMSPFFDYYADALRPLFTPGITSLAHYDLEATRLMLRLLNADAEVNLTTQAITLPVESLQPWAVPYYQTFQRRHGFVGGLSILDLLFNMGPEAITLLV